MINIFPPHRANSLYSWLDKCTPPWAVTGLPSWKNVPGYFFAIQVSVFLVFISADWVSPFPTRSRLHLRNACITPICWKASWSKVNMTSTRRKIKSLNNKLVSHLSLFLLFSRGAKRSLPHWPLTFVSRVRCEQSSSDKQTQQWRVYSWPMET